MTANNLLKDAVIQVLPVGIGIVTLPGLLAALSKDEVDAFPALRPHQEPAWHMFLVQLAALALHRSERQDLPEEEAEWAKLLRGLTANFPEDEPWRLVVEDWAKPAFLQPPVPEKTKLKKVNTADALDLLVTARNHDVKQAIARKGTAEDWLFALVSLQTCEGFGGRDNYGIARMNGGPSSRCLLSLAPLPDIAKKQMTPRPGAWFGRNVRILLETRDEALDEYSQLEYQPTEGIGLTWLEDWPEGKQLHTKDLDIWFIEICRRVRLTESGDGFEARKGTSKATRIDAKSSKGVMGDPFAPVHKDNKSFTVASNGFDYRMLRKLLLAEEWNIPLLAKPRQSETDDKTLALVCAALVRGQGKTEGFKTRILPLGGRIASFVFGRRRKELHELAEEQINTIDNFAKALKGALALAVAKGDSDRVSKECYKYAVSARNALERYCDEIFFARLWARFEAQEKNQDAAMDEEKKIFAGLLWDRTRKIFEEELPKMPCAGLFRPRAEARAWSRLVGSIRKHYPEIFPSPAANSDSNKGGASDAA